MSRGRAGPFPVRAASEVDLPGLLRCLSLAFEPFRSQYTPEAFVHTVLDEKLGRERLDAMRVLVAVVPDGPIVGTLAWHQKSPDSGHLRGMAVVPQFQGSGVAQALLDRALTEIWERGARQVTLRTTEPLERAIRFYERNGFHPSGTLADFHGMVVTERVRVLDRPPS